MKKILLGALFVVFSFVLVGCNGVTPEPKAAPTPKVAKLIKKYNLQIVDKEYVNARLGKGTKKSAKAILVDARPAKKYAGKTIPSSINIPDTAFDKYVNQLDGVSKDKEIIVYCGGWACAKSPKVAGLLQKRGFTNVKLYQAGEPEWSKKMYPQIGTSVVKAAVNKNSALIIDARPYKKYLGETIPGSLAIPDTKMNELAGRFPVGKNTPIITFCGGYDCAKSHNIAKKLLELKYTNVSVYAGGLPAWKKAGLKTTKGSASAKQKTKSTKTSPFLGPIKKGEDEGSVDAQWFIKNYKNFPKNVTIIDIRGSDERKAGYLKGSKHLPFEEMKHDAFFAKLPKDGYVIFHCAAGGRAMEAYESVKDSKYLGKNKITYLDANIECKGSACKIEPNEPLDPVAW